MIKPSSSGRTETVDSLAVRSVNRMRFMEALLSHGPIARIDICQVTGLSPATVSEISSALLAEGLIVETQARLKSGPGRPRLLLDVNAAAGHVVGIKMSMHEATLSLTDFKGAPVGALSVPHVAGKQDYESSGDMVAAAVHALLASCRVPLEQVIGIGLGLPGFVERPTGFSHWSPIFGIKARPFTDLISERLGVPVMAENDVNLVALAERWFGHGRGVDSFMVITVEHGVGMGLYLNGELYHGQRGMAAEFGHVLNEENGRPCRCARRGCVEAYAADYAIVARAAEVLGWPPAADGAAVHDQIGEITRLAKQGDARLRQIFAEAGHVLGRAAANVANILSPQKVIVTGEGMRAEDLLMRPFIDSFQSHVLAFLRETTPVVWHQWGDEVWAQGAAALVLSERFAGRRQSTGA